MTQPRKRKPGDAGSGTGGGGVSPAGPRTRSVPGLERYGFWWALGALVLLLVLFFNPLFFAGKTFLAPDKAASIAQQPLLTEAFASSGNWFENYPLWTPYVFSGMPAFGSLLASPYTNVTATLLGVFPDNVRIVFAYAVMGLMTWLLLRRRGLGTLAALFGAVAFVFTTHVIVFVMFGHNTKVLTLIYLPVVILAVSEVWNRPTVRWSLVLALAVANMLLAKHIQMAYYTFLAVGLFLLLYTVYAGRDKLGAGGILARWAAVAGGTVLGLAGSALLVIPTHEYAAHSIRGGTEGGVPYSFATSWSFHPAEMATFFVPSFMGFGGTTYWGRMPFTDSPHYMGILVLFLAVVALVRWPRERFHVYLVLLSVFALLVSFGHNFPAVYNILFEYFPFFNKFRVPVMILVLLQFSAAILAATAVHRIAQARTPDERKRTGRSVGLAGGIVGGLVVLLGGSVLGGALDGAILQRLGQRFAGAGLSPAQVNTFAAQQLPAIKNMVQTDTLVGIVVLALGLAAIWGFLRGRIPARVLTAGLLLLAVADLWHVDHRPATYHPRTDRTRLFAPNSAVRFLQEDPEPYRILPLTPPSGNQNWYAYHLISSILGYHPAKLKIYEDVVNESGPVGVRRLLSQGNFNVLNILNTKYVVADREIAGGPLEPVHRGDQVVIRNNGYLARMWFPRRARIVSDPARHLEALADPAWNPRDEVLTFEDLGTIDPSGGGTAAVTRYEPREIRASVTAPAPTLLVVSEVYYDAGWHANVDGAPAEIHRVNYLLRGIRVPAGAHELVLRFDPPSIRAGLFVNVGAYGLILVLLGASLVRSRFRRPVSA